MTTLRRRLTGLAAFLLLLAIVVGLPVVLLALDASPIPHTLPTWEAIRDAFTAPDDGTLALTAIKVIAWAAWLFLTVSILLEVISRSRGIHAPRLPGLAMPQSAARGLVGAAVLLFVAPLSSQVASATPAAAAPAAVSAAVAGAPATSNVATASTAAAQAPKKQTPPGAVTHTVKHGETLWSIAEEHLGSGTRYKEIVRLNPDLPPGGSFVRAGDELLLPAPAPTPAGAYTVKKGDTLSEIAQEKLGDADRYPEIVKASEDITQPGGVHLTDPDVIDVGWTLEIPGASPASTPVAHAAAQAPAPRPAPVAAQPATPEPSPAPAASPSPAPATPASQAPAPQAPDLASASASEQLDEDAQWWPVRTAYGVGALLAAGVLSLIATRRRAQQRRRRPGHQLPMPEGRPADIEQELRATADTLSVESVDVALRALARECATQGTALPVVRAGRLTADQFDLYLAEPATLPAPWSGTADATVWTLELEASTALEDVDVSEIPAPYPALVTIGHDEEDGHVFLDLEYLGALGVAGDPSRTREILAALAIELATSTWADDLQVTIVGAYPELEDALQTGRIRYLPSVGRILDDLAARAEQDRAAFEDAHTPDLQHARVTGAAPDSWTPEIVLLAGAITHRQRNQLEALVDELPRVALAAITSGVSVGEWALDLTAGDTDDQAILSPIGLQIRPQRIPAEQYGHILELASLTDVDDVPEHDEQAVEPEPTLAQISTIKPVDDVAATTPANVEAAEGPSEAPEAAIVEAPAEEAPMDAAPEAVTTGSLEDVESPTEPAAAAEPLEVAEVPEEAEEPAAVVDEEDLVPAAEVQTMPLPAPKILVMGPVELVNAGGKVESSKRGRLLEYAAYLALNPGASHTAIDDAIWPNRKSQDNLNTRNTATSKLRSWLGRTPEGEDYLPRHQSGNGYGFLPSVRTDVDVWNELLVDGPLSAPTENLAEALKLVRGRPFEGHHPRYYGWSERIAQRLISEIVDASYELSRRRLMEGRWRAAEEAVVVGLSIEPAQERLWRMRILAAHESRNAAAEKEAIDRMLTITQELECDLEPETETLLAALQNPRTEFDQLMANAL